MRFLLTAVASLAAAVTICSPLALADQPFAGCLDEFVAAQPPQVVGTGIADALCSDHFATLFSEAMKTPFYSAERLTSTQITAAIHLPRAEEFHADDRLPAGIGPELDDYRHSGFDRGHMAPNGDMPDGQSQYESFALSNVVPQDADDNRHLWADIELAVRELVLAGGDTVYVVTGPIFEPDRSWLRDSIAVPSLLFKAIYDPDAGIAGVYVAHNAPGQSFEALSLSAFTRRFGIAPFPALIDNPVASLKAHLPMPRSRRAASYGVSGGPSPASSSLWRLIERLRR